MARRINRKPLTDEERDARRKADRERIEQAARALLTTEGWQRWIKVRASNGLSRYSLVILGRSRHRRGVDALSRGRHVAVARAHYAAAAPSAAQRVPRRG